MTHRHQFIVIVTYKSRGRCRCDDHGGCRGRRAGLHRVRYAQSGAVVARLRAGCHRHEQLRGEPVGLRGLPERGGGSSRLGRSPRPATDEPLLFHAAERVCRAMEALGIERAHLVGNSYGGGVAMQDARIEECLHQSQNTFAADTLPHPCPSRLRAKIHRCTRRCHLP